MAGFEYHIEVRNLSTWFGKKAILKNISCYFEDNTITAIMGPSGCGKSTLLRTLNRLNDLVPSFRLEGQVLFGGENIYETGSSVYDLRKRIGMVFQKPNPFPMSIQDNITYGPKLHGVKDEDELNKIVEQSLRKAALWRGFRIHESVRGDRTRPDRRDVLRRGRDLRACDCPPRLRDF